jgi:hypothetical protein
MKQADQPAANNCWGNLAATWADRMRKFDVQRCCGRHRPGHPRCGLAVYSTFSTSAGAVRVIVPRGADVSAPAKLPSSSAVLKAFMASMRSINCSAFRYTERRRTGIQQFSRHPRANHLERRGAAARPSAEILLTAMTSPRIMIALRRAPVGTVTVFYREHANRAI